MRLQPVEQIEIVRKATQCGDWSGAAQALRQLLQTEEDPSQGWPPQVQEAALTVALQLLETGDFATRWQVAKLLPALGSVAIAPLITILHDGEADPEERWFVGRLLGEFRGEAVITALVTVLQNTDDSELAAIAAQALANQGAEAIAPLTAALSHPTAGLQAIHALAQIPDAAVVPPLLSAMAQANPDMRAAALLALSNFQDDRILPVLVVAAQDRAATVRRAAAIGLGRRATPAAEPDLLPVLSTLLKDWQLPVCEQAAIALGRLQTTAAMRVLAAELQSSLTPPPLQIALIRALAWTETSLALTLLHQALPQLEGSVLLEAIQVLGRSNESLQSQAATILLQFWSAHNAPADLNPSILQALAHAWELLGDRRAIPPLEQLQHHPQPQVVLHASSALQSLGQQDFAP